MLYSHRSTVLHSFSIAMPDALSLSLRDTVMPVVPMFHVNAWGMPYAAPMTGAKLVFPGPKMDGASLYEMMELGGVTVSALIFVLFAAAALYALWLHFAPRDRGNGRFASWATKAPIPVVAGFMVVVFIASMAIGLIWSFGSLPAESTSTRSPARARR